MNKWRLIKNAFPSQKLHSTTIVLRPLKQNLQRAIGVSRVFGAEDLADRCHFYGDTPYYRLRSESAFAAGWYMLSVSVSTLGIGHSLKISGSSEIAAGMPGHAFAHLLLGSHTKSKRLFYLDTPQRQLYASIDSTVESRTVPSIEISRVSRGFALTRMRKKLEFAGSSSSSVSFGNRRRLADDAAQPSDIEALYAQYSRLMERHIIAVDYTEWLQNRNVDADSSASAGFSRVLGSHPSLTLSVASRENTRSSLRDDIEGSSLVVQNLVELVDFEDLQVDLRAMPRPSQYSLDTPDNADKWSDYIVFTGTDTRIAAGALDCFLEVLQTDVPIDLYYSDHDMVAHDGKRFSPVFKPEWNPELLRCGNYIGRCFVVSRRLFELAGGWNDNFNESAHFDFLLRAAPFLEAENVCRIPRILFHRIHSSDSTVPYLADGEQDSEVLQNHLDSMAPATRSKVEPGLIQGSHRIRRPALEPAPTVDIIIPSKDKIEILECCIQSILNLTDYPAFRIVIVDNGSVEQSTHDYYKTLDIHDCIEILSFAGEFNYSAINNYAVSQSAAEVIVLLNNDTEVCHIDWLNEMVSQAVRPEIGCVGAKLYYSNNLVQHAGVIVGLKGVAGHAHRFSPRDAQGYCGRLKLSQNVLAVTAACLAVRRDVYNEVGGLDAINLKVAYNDVDFCLRVNEAGYSNLWTPYAELYHHESLSRGSDDTRSKSRRFKSEFRYMQMRWDTANLQDPSYNPNLANDQEDFSLAA